MVRERTGADAAPLLQIAAVRRDDIPVPERRILEGATLGGIVHMDQAETDIITSGPFKVVKQAPVGIPGTGIPSSNARATCRR